VLLALVVWRVAGARRSQGLFNLGIALVVTGMLWAAGWQLYEERAVEYFTEVPSRLLVPLGIIVAGTVVGLVIMILPAGARRKLLLAGWGMANLLGTGFVFYAGYFLCRVVIITRSAVWSMLAENAGLQWLWYLLVSISPLGLGVLLVFSWRAFVRRLRKPQAPAESDNPKRQEG
jgi:hypothetical protein